MTSRPFHLMIKPTGAACNLACEYCYYLGKAAYYPGSRFRMDDPTLERITAAYLQTNPAPQVVFGWQGGEPLLMGRGFYQRAIALQAKHTRPNQRVQNTLQTNGLLIDDEWAAFFGEHGFLVGVSIDGPPDLHDRYRRDGAGKPSYARALAGVRALQRAGVMPNVLVTVNRANADHPVKVYRHLTALGFEHVQFIPVVEHQPKGRKVTQWSVRPDAFGRFLCEIFDYWARNDVGRVFVQTVEATLSRWLGGPPSLCVFAPTCGLALAVEHTGDLYACDHFVYPDFLRGQVSADKLASLVEGDPQREFGMAKADVSGTCRECPVLWLCGGDCPKHRLRVAADGKPISYLCSAYRTFFAHSELIMRAMASEVRAGRPAANVMEALREA